MAAGTPHGTYQAYIINVSGQILKASEYRPLIVAYRQGEPVQLEHLGRLINSVQNDKVAGWYNNTKSIILAVQRQPGENTVRVVDDIKALIPSLRDQMPTTIDFVIRFDRSGVDTRIRPRCPVHAHVDGMSGGSGGVFVFAKPVSNHHPKPCAANVDHRHFQRHVPAGLRCGQSFADDAYTVGRVCGGRRDRHAREHCAARRIRRTTIHGSASRVLGNRFYDHFNDAFSGCSFYPGPVHGQHTGPFAA